MNRDFDSLVGKTFDLIVVGGGIIGAGIARDAALRGLQTLLLEKEDFAYGTTSRSSRLIHGGLRYLGGLQFRLVRQALKEREVLLGIAPHLVQSLPFVIPITRGAPLHRLALALGMHLYDLLPFGKSLPSHRRLSRRQTLELEPGLELEGLVGSYLYYDCQVPFVERLCLENVLSAAEHGASLMNHAKVTGLLRADNAVCGVQVQDLLSGEVYQVGGRVVVNAAGHWVDCVRDMLDRGVKPMVRRTKGIHLLIPQISRHAIVLFARADGRLFFVIPWQGYSLIGTTDTDYSGDLDAVDAEARDVDYLLAEVRRAFPGVGLENIFYTIAGLRSLADSGGRGTSDISRQHKLVDHEKRDGVGGFVSVLGGKITSYRIVAKDTVDLVCRKLGLEASCSTAEAPLPGAPAVPQETVEQAAQESGMPVETVAHLATLYGSRFSQVLSLVRGDAQEGQPLCPHCRDVLAQVRHAVEKEGALTVSDFLLRRSTVGLGPCQGLDAVETVAQEMGRLLGWSTAEQQRQVEAYRASAALGQRFRVKAADVGAEPA
ncbi:MAG: glycerol-3-phosphate dehydrogenase/oxidase [Dehalococcoidia bacterium]|nr:glycerol-3-phosphate dehydrogenase/oxidase [Chloroflexota bacterium]MCK4242701.1 glycerol-3-phosphate dehydrogenase/oxidase [Dehalococcoidia bacterium]